VSPLKTDSAKPQTMTADSCAVLHEVQELLKKMQQQDRPDFFCIGFYALGNPGENLQALPVSELNAKAAAYLEEDFMRKFVELEDAGVIYSHDCSLEAKHELLKVLADAKAYFSGEFEKKSALDYAAKVADKVEGSIDRLEINKDSVAYTFRTSMVSGIEKYFYYMKHNPKEEARFARQTAKREALLAKGKTVDWKVVPKVVFPLEGLKADLIKVISNLEARTAAQVASSDKLDSKARCVEINEFLKDKASKVVTVVTREIAKERAIKLMEEVGINEPRMRFYQYPFEFSGGMRQRIVIAIALSADPEILICDEPTTALDVTIQAQILELINRLKVERNLSVIFITHDLGVVANMADDIAVMYAGKIVEQGSADDIFYDPRHPYTWALLSSMPDLDTKEKLDAIPGTPPNMIYPPVGDAFADRNKYAMQIDFEQQPPMFEISETHRAATWLLHPDAPKVEIPKIITDRIARMKAKNGGVQ
jgi:oligopeptide/dipeptide ABC transporter ATP-binding protein